RLKNGQLLDYPGTVGLIEQSVEEALAVIRCLGIDLIYPDPLERVKTVASATAGNIASMLQDVLSQRRTEIDSINGAVVREGLRLGIPTPVNETLTHLVKTIEVSYGAGV
ncbi:MAG: ketopantoate reductase C-terminal domain-containing protein, partial [Candidatus Adiutricales bacterium]